MQQENKRENPQGVIVKGIEPVSRPAELKVLQTGIRPDVKKTKNMLQFSNSLKEFATGLLVFDRAQRLQGREEAEKIYLEQIDKDKAKWSDLTDKVPFYSRINPYTKEYYGELLAYQIADTLISQNAYNYSTSQLISKPVEELKKLTDEGKKSLMGQTEAKGLSPSNKLNAIKRYERANEALYQDYYSKHAEYNYKQTINLFGEKITQTLRDLDPSSQSDKKTNTLISDTLNKLSNEGIKNGLVDIDIAKAIKTSSEDLIYNSILDPLGHFDEANFLKDIKDVKVNNKTLDELIPHFSSDIKMHIQNCYDAAMRKEERAQRLEDLKYKNAKIAGDTQIFEFFNNQSDPTSPETIAEAKVLVKQLAEKDPYFKANLGYFLKTIDSYTRTFEDVSSFESRYKLADYYYLVSTNPSAISPGRIYDDYKQGKISFSHYRSLLGVYTDMQNKGLTTQAQLLSYNHKRNLEQINNMNLNERLKQEMIEQENDYYINAFTKLHDPLKLDENALHKYDNDTQYILNIANDKNAQYNEIDTQQKVIDGLNQDILSNEGARQKSDKQYSIAAVPSTMRKKYDTFFSNEYKSILPTYAPIPGSAFPFAAFRSVKTGESLTINTDISGLINQKMVVTSEYGKRTYKDKNGKVISGHHGGVDHSPSYLKKGDLCLTANIWGNAKVYASRDTKRGGGNFVKIIPDSHPNAEIYIMHLSAFINGLKLNQYTRVKNNVPLGIVGHTGNATADCAHNQYAINGKVVSPQEFEKRTGLKVTY